MIDTFGIFVETSEPLDLTQSLEALTYHTNTKTGETSYTGKLKNLKIKQVKNGIIISGSVPKFYYGDNLMQLTRQDAIAAIDKISDELGINISDGKLFRLDIGVNLKMDKKLNHYLNQLGNKRYFKKTTFYDNQTISYQNQQRELMFYDKLAEMKKKKAEIPDAFKEDNILRIEYRIKKRLKNHLPILTIKGILEEKNYRFAIDKFHDEFLKVEKMQPSTNTNITNIQFDSVKDFQKLAAYYGIQNNGIDYFINLIETKIMDKTKRKRMKDYLKGLMELPTGAAQDNEQEELTVKFEQAIRHYR